MGESQILGRVNYGQVPRKLVLGHVLLLQEILLERPCSYLMAKGAGRRQILTTTGACSSTFVHKGWATLYLRTCRRGASGVTLLEGVDA